MAIYNLHGKVALITGGARGQGEAEGELFIRHGAQVMLADLLDDQGQAVAKRIGARYCHLDVTSEEDWDAAVAATIDRFGHLDVLVNNAGIHHVGRIEETSRADWDRVLAVNLTGVFLGMQAAVRPMKRNGGSIVNITSIGALTGRQNIAAYCASKWGLRGLTKTAAVEFGRYGIRVNAVAPGLTDTAMTRDAYGEEAMQARGAQLPVGRPGTPQDIGNVVLFLASDASAFCSGAEFTVDGGETCGR